MDVVDDAGVYSVETSARISFLEGPVWVDGENLVGWVVYVVKTLTSDKETAVTAPCTVMEGLRADGIFKGVPFPVLLG